MTYKRIEGATPCGGDYLEIHYLDRFGNPADERDAVRCIMRECKNNGKLLNESVELCKK